MFYDRNYIKYDKEMLTLAIDFDGTIVCDEASKDKDCGYKAIGALRLNAKEVINRLYDEGYYIIIWTSRNGDSLINMIDFLNILGIKYHTINENNPANVSDDFKAWPKVLADIYIDDRQLGGLPNDWESIYMSIKLHQL